jgi:hypothetical protein
MKSFVFYQIASIDSGGLSGKPRANWTAADSSLPRRAGHWSLNHPGRARPAFRGLGQQGRKNWDRQREGAGFLNNFGPAILEGLEEFLLGKLLNLEHELTEIGERRGCLGLDVALSGGREESGEGGIAVAGGEDVGVEKLADLATRLLCGGGAGGTSARESSKGPCRRATEEAGSGGRRQR